MAQPQSNTPTQDLPLLSDGVFRDRGAVNTRLETFVDAAFAFTLTLLVISFDRIPENVDELITALKSVPAFLGSFLLLMMFWFAHRSWSRRYGLDETGAALISAVLIFILLVYVYPLRALTSTALSAITGGWVPREIAFSSEFDVRALFAIFGVGFTLACLCITALYGYALRRRQFLDLSAQEQFITRVEIVSWSILAAFGVASTILSGVLPAQQLHFSGWIYASLAVVMPVFGWRASARFNRLFPTG